MAVGIALTIPTVASPLSAQSLDYMGSLQLSSGDYIFPERTTSVLLFNGLSGSFGSFRVSASLPVIYQTTPFVSYTTGVLVPSGGPEHAELGGGMRGDGRMGHRDGDLDEIALADTSSVGEVGIGDVSAHAELELIGVSVSRPALRLTADVKVPVADVDRGFSTGEWDYAAGLSISQHFGRTLAFVDVAYWILGDLPDLELQDPFAYAVGVGYPLSERMGFLLTASGYSTIIEGTDPPAQISVGLSYLLSGNRGLLGGAALGLTESSPDVSFSFGWRVAL